MKLLHLFIALIFWGCTSSSQSSTHNLNELEIIVLGIAQDAGFPQADCEKANCSLYWKGIEEKRHVVSLGLVDRRTQQSWMFEATPDFTHQLRMLNNLNGKPSLSGIFLTHAHIGHYTGLMYLGHEAMGAGDMPVYAMPRMADFLTNHGPWSQLVGFENINLQSLKADSSVVLSEGLSVTPFLVPHRDEFSETVGYRIDSPDKSVLFIPDINKWHLWNRSITEEISTVDVAFLDATFYDGDELPGRDMSQIPHPFVVESMELFDELPASEKAKIIFIHFNHTNPLILDSETRAEVETRGYSVAFEGMRVPL